MSVFSDLFSNGLEQVLGSGIIDDALNCLTTKEGIKPAIGSVIYCKLVSQFEHSGIYIGNNKIVHLNGDGLIEAVSPKEFGERLDGLNLSFCNYTSSNSKGVSVGSKKVADIAKKMIGKRRDYSLVLDNCHQFTAGCLSGNFENITNFFWMLENDVKKCFGNNVGWSVMRFDMGES